MARAGPIYAQSVPAEAFQKVNKQAGIDMSSRDDAAGTPGRDGDDGVVVGFPDGGGPLGGQGPEDDPAVCVAG